MTRIAINVPQTYAVAAKLRQSASHVDDMRAGLQRQWSHLDSRWEGRSKHHVDGRVAAALRGANTLNQQLYRLGLQLDQIARRFEQADEMGGLALAAGLQCAILPGSGVEYGLHEPSGPMSMGELYDLVRQERVQIIKTGDNEYMVLIDGTNLTTDEAHNVGGAIESASGLPTAYQRLIRDYIYAHVPAGATVNFAGYSQGGLVANNLADDLDFLKDYTVNNVITFGAPINARENTNVDYHRFAEPGDPVPLAGRYAPLSYDGQTLIENTKFGLVASHTEGYASEQFKDAEKYAFKSGEWDSNWIDRNGKPIVSSPIDLSQTDGLSGWAGKISRGDWVRSSLDAPFEIGRTGLLMQFEDRVVKPITLIANKPLADEIERYSNRVYEGALKVPPPSRLIDISVDQGGRIWNRITNW